MREQLSAGIRAACGIDGTSIVKAAAKAGVGKSMVYRYMQGKSDVGINKMNRFCVEGLNRSMASVIELGSK